MYKLSRTVPVNEAGKSHLSRQDVWNGLLMKANNALPYVPMMKKCEVVERGDGWLLRNIMLNDVPLQEKVTFEPQRRVIFDRTEGDELGRIENVIAEDEHGNLTLTFSFGLTKKGLEGEAETRHFAPMEGAYMGAVASTLAAVRRTVDEKGREHLPMHNEVDTFGDVGWIYEFFRAADSLDLERLSQQMTEDTQLTFANYPTQSGIGAFRDSIGGLWSQLNGMSHSITGAWSIHDGKVGIGELSVMYTRKDNTLHTVKCCTILRRRGDKIADIRIHVDVTQL